MPRGTVDIPVTEQNGEFTISGSLKDVVSRGRPAQDSKYIRMDIDTADRAKVGLGAKIGNLPDFIQNCLRSKGFVCLSLDDFLKYQTNPGALK